MKITQLLKSILISTLGISAIGTITAASTSCSIILSHVTSVELNKTSVDLFVGDTKTLNATVLPENATDKSVTWSSSNEFVATVDRNGTITAIGQGNATITVTTNDGGYTDTCEVTVDVIHVTGITLNKTSTTLAVDDTEVLKATVSPENATDKSITWTSSDTNVASVDQNGKITAVGLGNATITVKTNDGNKTATCAVNVNTIHVTSVTLDITSTAIVIGDTKTLKATVLPENATDKSVVWSSSDTSVATVNQNGKITAVRPGNATITVRTNERGYTDTCEVTVGSIHVTSVELDKPFTTLAIGGTDTLVVTVSPENATDKSVTWTSSDTNVATVDQNGTITAVEEGNATITVTTNDGNKTATCAVSVTNPYVVLTANAYSTFQLANIDNNPDLQYSTDGKSWYHYSNQISINKDQTLYLKGNNPTGWSHLDSNFSYFSITGNVSISGNVMGLLDNGAKPGEQGNITNIPCEYCFYDLFRNSNGITSVSEDFLPATSLEIQCYNGMFYNCPSLTTAPKLPVTTLADFCYYDMFNGCTSLSIAPELPATSLGCGSYSYMFCDCTSLTTAPELPATTLATSCYNHMFSGCSSLNSIKIGYLGDYSTTYFNGWVTNVASSGTFYYNGGQTAQDFQLPSGWAKESDPYIAAIIVIIANVDSTLTLNNRGGNNPDLQYSIDKGASWNTYSEVINIYQGQTLYLKGNNRKGWSNSIDKFSTISIKGDVSISGNVMGLLDNGALPGEQGDITAIPSAYCFFDLFWNSIGITSISANFLPATTLASHCYKSMFSGCTSLTSVPELPATNVEFGCYGGMFSGCTSLKSAPELPAKSLAKTCYESMFLGCTALTNAPELPATTLVDNCYSSMFYNCTSLRSAPELPAESLASFCYYSMFSGCSSLNLIKIGYKGNYNSSYFYNWAIGVASSGTFYYNGSQTAQDFQLPSGWVKESLYVVLTANENSTLTLNNNGENNPDLQYSTDGISWSAYSSQLYINKGQTYYLKGNNPTGWSHSIDKFSTISITGNVSISGNAMQLLDNGAKPGEQGNITDIPCKYCFYNLFRNSDGITSVSDDFLPATSLASYCYNGMFYNCTALTSAPKKLPATTLTDSCYRYMFGHCTSLTTAPKLPATSLAMNCYYGMFYQCESLAEAPELPATTLDSACYQNMFSGCTSLTSAPELPATTVAMNCYSYMFQGCTSLTTAPELPAMALASMCYSYMFQGCTSLTTAPELPATTLSFYCYMGIFNGCSSLNWIKIAYQGDYKDSYFQGWVSGVASSGKFYYNGSQTAQNFQLPSGWSKQSF